MFKPVPMMRLSAVVLERDERNVLQTLGNLGVVQLTRAQADADMASLVTRDCSEELARCQRIVARVRALRESLGLKHSSSGTGLPVGLTLAQAEENLGEMEKETGCFLKRRCRLVERLEEIKTLDGRLASYRGLQIPLDQPDETSFLHFVTGSLPPDRFSKFQNELGNNVALLALPERNGRLPMIVMTTRQNRTVLENILQPAGFRCEVLPAVQGATVDTLSEADHGEQKQLAAELQQLQKELPAYAEKCSRPLLEIELIAENEQRLLEAGQHFTRTEHVVLLTGWVPRDDLPGLESHLRTITRERCVIEFAGPRDAPKEQIPILLRHPRWLRPFELLVTAYGLPHYRELEPTLFVAISYMLMFGVMFGDVGHGAILALGGLIAKWRSRKSAVRDVGLLFMFIGLSSMFFGFLYGSLFGLPSFKPFALWHDPLEGNPMSLLTGAIGVGVIMISLGLILNVINRWRHGDVLGGLLGKFGMAGAVFYWGSLLLLTQYAAIQSRGLAVPVFTVFLVLPTLGWMLKNPVEFLRSRRMGKTHETEDGLFASFSESVVGAFEAMLSYFANTISFVRLAAYAMSHAALLMAAFLMADAVKQVPSVGGVLAVLIVVLGNAVAILLEGVVASVQALRLEYYEFFGKFFAGGGQPFKPFRLQTTTVADVSQ